MKLSTVAPFLLGFVHTALAQSLPPSPTASVGCEPHGDHWHCDGPKVTSLATVVTSAAPATTSEAHDHDDHDHDEEDHDHDHDEHTSVSLKPSPTESYGCEPHGDHWHCAGHVSATATASAGLASSASASASATPSIAAAGRKGASGLAAAGLAIMALAL
ncbi:hypothetical protein B0T20DRAFT_45618 [Sordaria brevicollis]|uniref:Uncharacterized protein n=1 Tax=Sordaria brevicollis TaxID=83679 RepID=A0AAE0P9J6_SORBR|nr:hypothetical protein B0T20DRAFT_45618 [Sordaria brevicollis]